MDLLYQAEETSFKCKKYNFSFEKRGNLRDRKTHPDNILFFSRRCLGNVYVVGICTKNINALGRKHTIIL